MIVGLESILKQILILKRNAGAVPAGVNNVWWKTRCSGTADHPCDRADIFWSQQAGRPGQGSGGRDQEFQRRNERWGAAPNAASGRQKIALYKPIGPQHLSYERYLQS